ncbi:MAG: sigma-54-dependent Fis family transcriptional regulator, partial [Bacteroidales bacterium]|nr:sigma-54-dependent Fis family transcriptional regulator [Bacteroidales bacterium]
GAFTGAVDARKGYFEAADGGTIFLDEVADLPLSTQIRLLRVLESGEFIRVGSSKVLKTDVRVVAATNVDIADRIAKGKFREDLYYRLNSVPIHVPALRERKGDIYPLFMKFATDFSAKYSFPAIQLTEEAQKMLREYRWPGNVRQLKHVTEQISLLEKERVVTAEVLAPYLTGPTGSNLPALRLSESENNDNFQREILFKFIAEMQREISELKGAVNQLMSGRQPAADKSLHEYPLHDNDLDIEISHEHSIASDGDSSGYYDKSEVIEEGDLSMDSVEKTAIVKALERHNGNREKAAKELGISARTLYRRIDKYGL